MTREEALNALNLNANANNSAVVQKYNELYNEFQLRLSNAPTPNLKKMYQNKLKEIEQARNLLIAGSPIRENVLPVQSPTYQNTPPPKNTPTETAVRHHSQQQSRKPPNSYGVSPIWIFTTLACLAAAVLMGILWNDEKKAMDEARPKLSQLDRLGKILENGKMKVRNNGTYDLLITGMAVIYINDQGKLVKFEDYIGKTIRPSGTISLEKIEGDKITWDGSVVFYSFDVGYRNTYYLVSGIWSLDSKEGILKVNLDGY